MPGALMSVAPNAFSWQTPESRTIHCWLSSPTWTSPRFSTHHALSGCPLAFAQRPRLPGTLSWLPTFPVSFERSKPNISSSSMRPFPASQAQHISSGLLCLVSFLPGSIHTSILQRSFTLLVLELLMVGNHVVFIFVIQHCTLTPHRPLICVWLINGWIEKTGRKRRKKGEMNRWIPCHHLSLSHHHFSVGQTQFLTDLLVSTFPHSSSFYSECLGIF